MKAILVSSVLLAITIHLHAQIDGAPTGWWTDANGISHYGTPPSSSSDSSSYSYASPYSSDSSYSSGSSGRQSYGGNSYDLEDELEALAKDFERSVDDWQAKFKYRQEKQRLERLLKQSEIRLMIRPGGIEKTVPNSGTKPIKPVVKLFSLDKTGGDWDLDIIDLKPPAVSSQIRSGDTYARKKQWDQAIRHYQAALRVDPNDETARRKLAEAQEAKKKGPAKKGLFSRNSN